MSNLRDVLKVQYVYSIRGHLMVDNEPIVRLQLKDELGVRIIPLIS
ncbi:hypothetical protein ALC60_09503 [Trachymyrmex zeteki]|uniref:Uncharacterized protein n=1 Tax=Mycetomoellerius zeteki TaxID=64791 RepID=A0A151WU68_9HYME|nr:hypothetical protein ALC60_09503 [Trachymyrmex zeteki]